MKTVVSNRFSRTDADEHRFEVRTPEGVPLVLAVGRAGDRVGAFTIDSVIMVGLYLVTALGIYLAGAVGGGELASSLGMVSLFVIRNGYFIWHELRSQGRTPGKRRLGLRVIDARGRMLTSDAIIVRNLTREVELFLPLAALSNPELVAGYGPGWIRAISVAWCVAFLVMPLLNRERRRIGDLLAGTVVVRDPRHFLGRELTAPAAQPAAALEFTAAQLEVYGIYELQVLEELLRDEPTNSRTFRVVAEKIQRKIGWDGDAASVPPRAFLKAFYDAQRARLEKDLLLGKARDRKRDG